jgi:hypothetical protein
VDLDSPNPTPPFTSWETAAISIQDAVNVAPSNSTVLVANGNYLIDSPITVSNPIIIKSQNGNDGVSIDAQWSSRVFEIRDRKVVVDGFHILNGYAEDESTPSSSSDYGGGGIYCTGLATISNCVIEFCVAERDGGGLYGGKAFHCEFSSNISHSNGGGMSGSTGSFAEYCVFKNNSSTSHGGGIFEVRLSNCLVKGNYSDIGGGALAFDIIENCTIVDNSAGSRGGGVAYSEVHNSIMYFNSCSGSGKDIYAGTWTITHSCYSEATVDARGNIPSDPQFLSADFSNLRLSTSSPCIDAGFNAYTTTACDLDGNPRIVNTRADMGTYEFQTEASAINVPIKAVLEYSPDLQAWTNAGQSIEWLIPADSSNGFYRAKLEI